MTQKELKAVYKDELKKAWSSEKMVEHCSKSTAFIVEHNGELYGIETRFCFGYGMNGITNEDEEDAADRMARKAQESRDYFINQNLENINRWIKKLNEILEDMGNNWAEGNYPHYMIETGAHFYGQTEDCKLRYYSVADTFNGGIRGKICNDTELIKKLIAGYEEVKTEFIKRLNKYLNRYGMSKVETWSYLRD